MMQDEIRAALSRAGDAEERAAKAEMEILRLNERVKHLEARLAEACVEHKENRMAAALEARDRAYEKELRLSRLLRGFVKTFKRTVGFDPRHYQPTVEINNTLIALYEIETIRR